MILKDNPQLGFFFIYLSSELCSLSYIVQAPEMTRFNPEAPLPIISPISEDSTVTSLRPLSSVCKRRHSPFFLFLAYSLLLIVCCLLFVAIYFLYINYTKNKINQILFDLFLFKKINCSFAFKIKYLKINLQYRL